MCRMVVRGALARRLPLSRLRPSGGVVAEGESPHLRVRRLRSSDLGDGGDGDARLEACADDVVSGGLADGDAQERLLGAADARATGSWLLQVGPAVRQAPPGDAHSRAQTPDRTKPTRPAFLTGPGTTRRLVGRDVATAASCWSRALSRLPGTVLVALDCGRSSTSPPIASAGSLPAPSLPAPPWSATAGSATPS